MASKTTKKSAPAKKAEAEEEKKAASKAAKSGAAKSGERAVTAAKAETKPAKKPAKSAAKKDDASEGGEQESNEATLLDLSADKVKKMIKAAKKRGYVTMDELNSVLPSEEVSSEQIEDTMSMLSDMGINVVEEEDLEEDNESTDIATTTGNEVATAKKREPTDRTDDPVRMYLREMGTVELLSREGEIAIAKRIEAGRETMIAGLCESPLTFQAIIIWRDELNEGNILLRDIIDLEATYAGPEAKQAPAIQRPAEDAEAKKPEEEQPKRASSEDSDDPLAEGEGEGEGEEEDDEDDDENALSLAAMEAELKPQVIETFDTIADTYKKLRRLQDQLVENRLQNKTLSPSQERRYKKLK
ncbi:MAG: hypothetical protein KDJ64_06185, partial [Nitratireductor sp.]|nr:hypothetical protein [Nitratireductor sp.]